jgi:hypothetical protein
VVLLVVTGVVLAIAAKLARLDEVFGGHGT